MKFPCKKDSQYRANLTSVFALWVALTCSQLLFAGPDDPKDYVVYKGGLVDIPEHAYIEGSAHKGGIQPDYRIDSESTEMRRIRTYGRRIRNMQIPFWEKIERISSYVNKQFPRVAYDDPAYLKTVDQYRETGADVPLSEYLIAKAGVCREHALITHYILKAAGIDNFHAYATINRASNYYDFNIVEDHAFTVVKHRGEYWVVDPYYWGFHGFKLADLLSAEGITAQSRSAPIAQPGPGFRRIIEINRYPRIWVRKADAKSLTQEQIQVPGSCELMGFLFKNKI